MKTPHTPVLLDAVVDTFKDIDGFMVDATVGYGGHSEAILKANPTVKLIAIDQDAEAIAFSKKRLAPFQDRVIFLQGRYSQKIKEALANYPVKGVLADIGVSSLQLDKKSRGFGFDSDVLDMRMDQNASLSAYDVINCYSEDELVEVLFKFGEIRDKRIAREIVHHRPIQSAKELTQVVQRFLPTKKALAPLFQAIRIEVNQELAELEGLLDAIEEAKPAGATIAIITFHSLEDRIVKNRFKRWARSCICPPQSLRCTCGGNNALGKIITKKPITASAKEIAQNPRARSAKMRIFRIKEEG